MTIIIIYDNYSGVREGTVQYVIREYITCAGVNPFRKWLKKLDSSVQARVQARILRAEMGNLGDHKSVGDGVCEFRLDFGKGCRIYYGMDGTSIILLLIGGNKETQRGDIRRAKDYWRQYREV